MAAKSRISGWPILRLLSIIICILVAAMTELKDYWYQLPHELIAQEPVPERDQSRLLVYDRATGQLQHRVFYELTDYVQEGDVLVLNDSRVIPARLRACRQDRKEKIELLLVHEVAPRRWRVMAKPARKLKQGTEFFLLPKQEGLPCIKGHVAKTEPDGYRIVEFYLEGSILDLLAHYGEPPLPPYIRRPSGPSELDQQRYQTVYAQKPGSIAAPTAGLHFTARLLEALQEKGVRIVYVTLHVGPGTFLPVRTRHIEDHRMDPEPFEVNEQASQAINEAKASGKRIIAVGTTTVRLLESVAQAYGGTIKPCQGHTDLFIYPPFQFKVVDCLITNFHLPCSTLLMLVAAFICPGREDGREKLLAIYREAIKLRYRFYSYGDAMLIL